MILLDAFSRLPAATPPAPTIVGARASRSASEMLARRRLGAVPRAGPRRLSVSVPELLRAARSPATPRDAPHMRRSRDDRSLRLGGVDARQHVHAISPGAVRPVRWSDVPAIPPEMMFLPGGGPFSVYDMSSWSRTIFVPLSILYAHKPVGRAARRSAASASCFAHGRARRRRRSDGSSRRRRATGPAPAVETALLRRRSRAQDRRASAGRATCCADAPSSARRAWMIERLDDSDGLSAILPAMANSVIALKVPRLRRRPPAACRSSSATCDGLLLGDRGRRHAAHAALPVAGLGHRARQPRAVAGGRAAEHPALAAGGLVAARQAVASPRRLGAAQPGAARAAGTSSTATTSTPTSTTPAWR